MSIEHIHISSPAGKKEETVDPPPHKQIDALLEHFPQELQSRWEEEVADMKDEDAVVLLTSALERRKQVRRPQPEVRREAASEESLQMAVELRDTLLAHPEKIGSGGVADVIADPTSTTVCYKVVRDLDQYALCNGIVQESAFLEELADFSHAGVRTPRPYNTVFAPEFIALGMERLPGMSLEQMLQLPTLPEHFDLKRYLGAMESYLEELLKAHHVYHRDLRPGNMMFDPATGAAFLIDFGRSVHAYPDEKGFLEFALQGRTVRVESSNHSKLQYIEHIIRERFPETLRNK